LVVDLSLNPVDTDFTISRPEDPAEFTVDFNPTEELLIPERLKERMSHCGLHVDDLGSSVIEGDLQPIIFQRGNPDDISHRYLFIPEGRCSPMR
jgi:hypothetical protein